MGFDCIDFDLMFLHHLAEMHQDNRRNGRLPVVHMATLQHGDRLCQYPVMTSSATEKSWHVET